MIQVGSEVRVSMPAEVVEIYRGITGLKWFVVEMRNGERKHVLVSSLNEANLNNPENVDNADDGPEVSILRQPRIKAVSESKQGMFGIFFTSFRGEETRSAGFPGTYYQKSHAESIIAEKSTSTFRYYIKEIL